MKERKKEKGDEDKDEVMCFLGEDLTEISFERTHPGTKWGTKIQKIEKNRKKSTLKKIERYLKV